MKKQLILFILVLVLSIVSTTSSVFAKGLETAPTAVTPLSLSLIQADTEITPYSYLRRVKTVTKKYYTQSWPDPIPHQEYIDGKLYSGFLYVSGSTKLKDGNEVYYSVDYTGYIYHYY